MVAGPGGGAVLDGVLERVTFANPETGYTIARIAPERGGAELITAVGPLLGAQIGEFLRLRGRWSSPPEVRPAVRGGTPTPRCCPPPPRASRSTWARA